MSKNRKYQSASIRFGPALKAFLLCLLIGGSGVGYVWQKDQIYELGRQIKKREIRLTDLKEQNEKLKKQLAELYRPQFIERRAKELNLGLSLPSPGQIVRLREPLAEPAATPADRKEQLAAQTGRVAGAARLE
jgi:cell division protein FtsL